MDGSQKIIEELKTEIFNLKTRLHRIEDYLSSFPKIDYDYQDDVLIDLAKKTVVQYDKASASLLRRYLANGQRRRSL